MFSLAARFTPAKPRIRGGVHPEPRKEVTSGKKIDRRLPMPKLLYLSLLQHVGQPAEPIVRVGDRVLKGQLIAVGQGAISAAIHAPTSGMISDIIEYPATHPSALPTPTILLEPDGEDQWVGGLEEIDPFTLSAEEISRRVAEAGVVGMGGAAFPSAVKLNLGRKTQIKTLLINGGECEPYLTCDDRLMRERSKEIIEGVRIMMHALECEDAVVGIEDNKPEAFAALIKASQSFGQIKISQVPTLYPMGWDKQLIGYLTGKEVPADGRTADIGVLMHNVATAYAVQQAIRFGRPLISRIVTVSGQAVSTPKNVEALIGTPLRDLLKYCGLDESKANRYILGGPMMGDTIPSIDVPLIKGGCGVLALSQPEVAASDAKACIRCGRCVTACPVGLLPLEMMARIRAGQLDGAVGYGLKDCISCGSCSYSCPSEIPLVQYFKYASSELVARQQAAHKAEQTKRLADEKIARIERHKQEQAALAAERRAKLQQMQQRKAEPAPAPKSSISNEQEASP